MPWLPIIDDCISGADARNRAKQMRTKSWRLPVMERPNPIPSIEELPEPKKTPEIEPPNGGWPVIAIPQRGPSLPDIIKTCCIYFNVTKEFMLCDRRAEYIATPRHILMHMCYICTTKSLPQIGRYLNRDHSSVLHGCRRIVASLEARDSEITKHVEYLKSVILEGAPLSARAPAKPPVRPVRPKGRLFTQEEVDTITRMFSEEGYSKRDIGKAVGRSDKAIHRKICQLGIKKRSTRRFPTDEEERAHLQLRVDEKKTNQEMAEELCMSVEALKHRLQLYRIRRPLRGALWTPEEDSILCGMYRTGSTVRTISKKLDRADSSVRWRLFKLGECDYAGARLPIESSSAVLHP